VLGGGKFANGAITAAFVQIFNHESDTLLGLASKFNNWTVSNKPLDHTQWEDAGIIGFGYDVIEFKAGARIAVETSASGGPFNTVTFAFYVHAHPLDQYGDPLTIVTEAPTLCNPYTIATSVKHSSGFVGGTSVGTQVIQTGMIGPGGARWRIGLIGGQPSHDNSAYHIIRAFTPRKPNCDLPIDTKVPAR